ncbi:thrombin-like enzyme ancrod [Hermetia illucens]|uniref:thrombin-like enzyme ancrod n=1 Tax=Hermetia illucens TaxID=343691 RepID=UPI0018CC6851|nr:thrombin-like enzyme ancrod [Hermetia illucens]
MLSFGLFVILLMLTKRNVADIEKKNATDQCTPGQFPSHVCILYLKNEQLCGGTIIHPRHVLTSSYCFRDSLERRNLTKKFVLAGDVTWGHVKTRFSQTRNITHLIQHPGSYRDGFDLDDIAVLKVNQSFDENYYVVSIELSSEPPDIGVQCTILGWSQAGLSRKTTTLRKGLVYVQRQIKCGGNLVEDIERIICGANSDTTHTPCMVDPGGPLICNNKLAGVHTRANRDCDNQTYGSYFMNVAFYRDWITRTIEWDGYGAEPEARTAEYRFGGAANRNVFKFIIYLVTQMLRIVM